MTSFLQLNIDLKASWRLNCMRRVVCVCVGTCCVLIRCEFFLVLFFAPLTFTAADSSNLSSWGYRTFSHPATSVIKHDNRLMMIPAAQSHDRTLALFMMSFCNLSSLSNAFFFSPLLGAFIWTQQHNSTYFSVMTDDSPLSQSTGEPVGGGAGACLNFGKNVCVTHQDELFPTFAGLLEIHMIFFS